MTQIYIVVVQLSSCVQLFASPWTVACQASLTLLSFFFVFFSILVYQNISNRVPWATIEFSWLSILFIPVCISLAQTPNPSLSNPLPLDNHPQYLLNYLTIHEESRVNRNFLKHWLVAPEDSACCLLVSCMKGYLHDVFSNCHLITLQDAS